MKINDKSIKGIFNYDDSAIFERGDFVVEGQFLYVCKAESISGIKPSQDPNSYSIYAGGETATLEDFINYTNGTIENGEKLVSVNTLSQILNSYMSGFSESGLIDNTVSGNGEIFLSEFFTNSIGDITISSGSVYSAPLDTIMVEPSLNNAVFAVSAELESVKAIIGSSASTSVILRQYTYRDDYDSLGQEYSGDYTRIQELVDPASGLTKFRYMVITNGSYDGTFSNWTSTNIQTNFSSQVDTVISYYNSQIQRLEKERTNLYNSFRYRSLSNINNFGSSSNTTIPSALKLSDGVILTICLKKVESTNLYRTDNLVLALDDVKYLGDNSISYIVFDSINATIRFDFSSGVLSFVFTALNTSYTPQISIQNIYYMQKYSDYLGLDVEGGGWVNISESAFQTDSNKFVVSLNESNKNIAKDIQYLDSDSSLTFRVLGDIEYGSSGEGFARAFKTVEFYFSTNNFVDSEYHEDYATIYSNQTSATRPYSYYPSSKTASMTLRIIPSSYRNDGKIDTLTFEAVNARPDGSPIYSLGDKYGGRIEFEYMGMSIGTVQVMS